MVCPWVVSSSLLLLLRSEVWPVLSGDSARSPHCPAGRPLQCNLPHGSLQAEPQQEATTSESPTCTLRPPSRLPGSGPDTHPSSPGKLLPHGPLCKVLLLVRADRSPALPF